MRTTWVVCFCVAMDLVDLHRRGVEEFGRIAMSVRPGQWDMPTPCTDWTVRDLLGHVVAAERWTVPLLAGATVEQIGDRFNRDLLGADPIAAAREAAGAAVMAIAEPGALDRDLHLPYGATPARGYAWQLLADHLIHAWDLAAAIDADRELDPRLVAACASWFVEEEDGYRQAGVIGPRPESAPGDRPLDRLLVAFGRDPRWDPATAAVERFVSAFGSGDIDTVMGYTTADVVFETTGPGPDGLRVEGESAVREIWERLFKMTNEPAFQWEEVAGFGDRGIVRWAFLWRGPDGRQGRIRGADLLRLRNGRICERLSYVKG